MPLHGIYPSIAQPTSAAAAEPGPSATDYHPLELFSFPYIYDLTDSQNYSVSSGEIVSLTNTGTVGSSANMAPFSSSFGSVGPDVREASSGSGYRSGANFYTPSGGTIKGLHFDSDADIDVRTVVAVWELDYDLDGGTQNTPFSVGNQNGDVDVAVIKWTNDSTGGEYKWMGGNTRSTDIPYGESATDYRGLRIMVLSWPGTGNRRIACYDSNTSTSYSTLNSNAKDVDRFILGMRSQHSGSGGACRAMRGAVYLFGVHTEPLTASECNELARGLAFYFGGNAAAKVQDSTELVWNDVDFSVDHSALSHEPMFYADMQTSSTITTSTDEETFSCSSDDEIEVAASNTIAAGDHVTLSTSGSLPSGLAAGSYYVRSRNSTTLTLVSDYEDVWDGTAAVSITSGTGSGTHTLSRDLIDGISCDYNEVRQLDSSGTKATYVAPSGSDPGHFVGSAAATGSYTWRNVSDKDDGTITIVAKKWGSGSHSARAVSVGSQSGGDQWIDFGGEAGRARARYGGSIVTVGSSSSVAFTDSEIFVAYLTCDSSSGHRLRIYNAYTETWSESSLDTASIGEKFFEMWQTISIETGSKMAILDLVYAEVALSVSDINQDNEAYADVHSFQHADLT